MYLDGSHLKAVAEAQHMNLAELQQQSGLPVPQVRYYWDYPVTVTSQKDIAALARILQVEPHDLLIQGEPSEVFLHPDKFVWQTGDIEWLDRGS